MNLVSILITLLILSVLVVVHELGHFLAAKKTGVFVEEFAIGMGPKIFSKQGKETLFSIRIFPIGGFCKMRGEEPELDEEGNFLPRDPDAVFDPGSFDGKTKKQKLLILVGGSGMNFIFAFLCLIIIGFLLGRYNILQVMGFAVLNIINFGGIILDSLKMLITGQVGFENLAGPIGMTTMVSTFINEGFVVILSFMAMLSVNLGIINLLPIPALDGGRILIIFIEIITRRKFSPEVEIKINLFGFMIMILLALAVAFNDIMRIAF